LETYGDCPFKFFAGGILGLKVPQEIEEDITTLDLGSFYHEVMKCFFIRLTEEMSGKVDLREVGDDEIIKNLLNVLEELNLDKRFYWLPPGISDLIKRRIKDEVLPQFLISEAKRTRKWNSEGFFPNMYEKDLRFQVGDLEIRGKADRVDISDKEAAVIDYKYRSSTGKKFFDYHNLQLPLYLLALEGEGFKPFGGYYRFIEKPEEEQGSDIITKKDFQDQVKRAKEQVYKYIDLIQNGFFPPVIDKKDMDFENKEMELKKSDHSPCSWCEFSDLCRVDGGSYRKM